jgi:hypothetical protein
VEWQISVGIAPARPQSRTLRMAELITGSRELIRESRVAVYPLSILYNCLFLNVFIRLPPLNTAVQNIN